MSYVPIEKVLKTTNSVYKSVLLAAQRAVEIAEEASKTGKPLTKKPTTLAIEEIIEKKVKYKIKK
jgi:DNA-directed RNA polymerase omega subunit